MIQIGGGSISDIEVFDHNDGTYTVQYKILDSSKTYPLAVTINGDITNVKSSVITPVPNKPHAFLSTLATASPIILDVLKQVNVQIFDSFGNPVLVTQPIVQVVNGKGKSYYSTFTQTSPSFYSLMYQVPSGDSDTSNCGFYTLSAFLLEKGGLEGKYFTNRWFSGTPYLT